MSAQPNGESLAVSDGELLSRFASTGDQQAFSQLVARHGPMVLRICRRISGGDPHGAEDAAQDVFLMLASRANALKTRMSVAGWLYRTSWHVATRQRRNVAVRDDHETRAGIERAATAAAGTGSQEPIPFAVASSELSDALSRALGNLTENYRNALVLHHVAGYTVEETAQMLGVKVGTAAAWMSRGRSMMRDRLEVMLVGGICAKTVADWFAELAPNPGMPQSDWGNLSDWGSSAGGRHAISSAAGGHPSAAAAALLHAPARFGKAACFVGASAAAVGASGAGASGAVVGGMSMHGGSALSGTASAGAKGLLGVISAAAASAKTVAVATAAVGATLAGSMVLRHHDAIAKNVAARMPESPPPAASSSSPSNFFTAVPEPSFVLPVLIFAAFAVLTFRGRRRVQSA